MFIVISITLVTDFILYAYVVIRRFHLDYKQK